MRRATAVTAVLLTLALSACGGDDGNDAPALATPAPVERDPSNPYPNARGVSPEVIDCMRSRVATPQGRDADPGDVDIGGVLGAIGECTKNLPNRGKLPGGTMDR